MKKTLHSTSLNESVNYESDEAILSRAIEILRGYTTPNDKFNGEFGLDCERKSVDDRVTEFILKWITGSKSVQLDDSPRLRQALTIGQIVDFNSIKYGRKDTTTTHHLAERETPQQVYIYNTFSFGDILTK